MESKVQAQDSDLAHLSTYPSTHPYIHPLINSSIHPSSILHPSPIHPSSIHTCIIIHPSSIHHPSSIFHPSSVHACFHPAVIHPSIHHSSAVHPSPSHLSIIHASIHRPWVWSPWGGRGNEGNWISPYRLTPDVISIYPEGRGLTLLSGRSCFSYLLLSHLLEPGPLRARLESRPPTCWKEDTQWTKFWLHESGAWLAARLPSRHLRARTATK